MAYRNESMPQRLDSLYYASKAAAPAHGIVEELINSAMTVGQNVPTFYQSSFCHSIPNHNPSSAS